MRIGLNSLIGEGFGTGSFSFGEVPSGGEFPAEGTFYESLTGVTYPPEQGGASFSHPVDSTTVPSQVCDVDVYHDGLGGFYTDWANATNIAYVEGGTVFWQSTTTISYNPVEVPEGSGNYFDSSRGYDGYVHDGTGYYVPSPIDGYFLASGTEVSSTLRDNDTVEVPALSENYFNNGFYDTYVWNGTGGFSYSTNLGSYYPNNTYITDVYLLTDVPTGSENYYPNGKETVYRWNGTGGFTSATEGSFLANGTQITSQQRYTEVPSESGNFFSSGKVDNYYWDGTGGYTVSTIGSYYASGTYITEDETYTYYWDGTGGYYN